MQIISQNFKGNMNFIKQGPLEFLCFTISYHYPSYLKFYWHSYNIPVNFLNSFSFLTVSGDSVNSSSLFNGTFNAYWNTCKQNNKFITGNTHIVCQSESTWTGIRKYNIGISFYCLSNWRIQRKKKHNSHELFLYLKRMVKIN